MPLHPLIVHFPIALLLVAAVIELLSLKFKNLSLTGTILLVTGFASGVLAFMTGDSGERFAEMNFGDVEGMIHHHEDMARLALIIFGVAMLIKLFTHFSKKFIKPLLIVVVILSILGSGVLAYAGHLGGQIVYENSKVTNTR